MRLRKWAAKEAERMLFATKDIPRCTGGTRGLLAAFSFAEEPPIFKEVVEEDEAEAPAGRRR